MLLNLRRRARPDHGLPWGRRRLRCARQWAFVGLFSVLGPNCGAAGPQGQSAPATPPNSASGDRTCPPGADVKKFSPRDTGEVVEGPACVGVMVNVLRYSVEFGRSVTITAGPNLAAGLEAPSPAKAGPGSATLAPGPITEEIEKIRKDLAALRGKANGLDADNSWSAAKVAQAFTDLKALVAVSDDIFRSKGAAGVVAAKNDPALKREMDAALAAPWASGDEIFIDLRSLQARVSDLLLRNPTDAEKARLQLLQTSISDLITAISPSLLSGDKTKAFSSQKAVVQYWARLFDGLKEEAFLQTTNVTCGVLFNQNKQTAVKLVQYDRLPLFDGQQLAAVDLKDPFVTVNCSSRFAVAAGVEFRFLANSTFGLVPSGSSGALQFDVTDRSKTIPLPIAMVHVRLTEGEQHRYGLYASFGAAAHITDANSGGSGAEYLTGLSVGLLRTLFITAGWHVGRVSALGGGYKLQEPVPTGVTTVPVVTSYQHGFGLAITFTKP